MTLETIGKFDIECKNSNFKTPSQETYFQGKTDQFPLLYNLNHKNVQENGTNDWF